MGPLDPRVITGPTMLALGLMALFIAGRLWLVHPVNRVFRLGPFVTERGMRALLNMRQLFLALGAFLTTQGLASVVFWFFREREVNDPLVQFLGALGAGMGLWTLALAGSALIRLLQIR